ncbi:sel1 repeat family protein [bacterium]|nr:MAG: sel1 repeat family protein [bacterium]
MTTSMRCLSLLSLVAAVCFPSHAQADAFDRRSQALKAAAARGDRSAMVGLGELHVGRGWDGGGFVRDPKQGVAWLSKAALLGEPAGMDRLGQLLLRGVERTVGERKVVVLERNDEEGLRWVRKAESLGFARASHRLGNHYWSGVAVPKDRERALAQYLRAANEGRAAAMGALARGYLKTGRTREGLTWLGRAAEQGYPRAMVELADAYLKRPNGDAKAAARLYKRAGEAGYPAGYMKLGLLYRVGKGVPADRARAASLFRRVATQLPHQAAYLYGLCLLDGDGVRKDPAGAERWLRMGVINHVPEALFTYARCLERGTFGSGLSSAVPSGPRGLQPSPLESEYVRLYREAAAFGEPRARRALARLKQPRPTAKVPRPTFSDGWDVNDL